MPVVLLAFSALATLAASPARAQTLVENTAKTGLDTSYVAQSVTTPGGIGYNNITFNFFDAAGNPEAFGTLYLFTQEYNDRPIDLSSSTFTAKSQSIASGAYVFDPNLVLQANTLYYFYSDTSFENSGSGNDPYAGGDVFAAYAPDDTFGLLKYGDADFRMSGSRVSNFAAVPEPSEYAAMGMLGATLLFGTVRARRKKAA